MKEGQKLWTRDELILAINLYCKLPFGKMHGRNHEINELAKLIGRTPASVALKLGNFASFDPTLKARGIRGASNASKLDKSIWDEFYTHWDDALIESEKLLAEKKHTTIEKLHHIDFDRLPKEGKEKLREVKVRINQAIFRNIILATYNNTCCITGINNPELLVAAHISKWSKDEANRLNPMNGLCLNALHDRAFECGLLTISAKDYKIKISSELKKKENKAIRDNFLRLENKQILTPDKFLPSKDFLLLHNKSFRE